MALRTRPLNLISCVLYAITVVRLLTMCLSQPIAAYGNNYDFVRQSSCVGVWQSYDDRDKTARSPERPVDRIAYDGDRRPAVCLPSSDNAFPWLIAQISVSGVPTELRWVGLLKAMMALGLFAGLLLQPIPSAVRVSVALACSLVLGDFAIGLYFDTLYLEASVIICLTIGAGLAVAATARRRAPSTGFLVLATATCVWLTFARQQYSPLGVLTGGVVVVACVLAWRKPKAAAVVAAAICLAQIAFLQIQQHPSDHTRQVDKANRTDVFLGAVLPSASDPIAALARVGLPPSCASSIGKTWYSPGFQQANPCPEVYNLSRARLLALFIHDPRTLVVPLLRVAKDSQDLLLPYLGHFERPADATRIRFRLLQLTSLSTWLAALPSQIYLALIAVACLAGPVGFGAMLAKQLRRHRDALLMAGLGGTVTFYALASSAFGDGFYEVQRHAVGVLIGLSLLLGALVMTCLTHANARERSP